MAGSSLDAKLLKCLDLEGWNISVPWFLCTSILYYKEDLSVISDQRFDWLCKGMLERWADIRHRHRRFITVGDLQAGTGFALPWRRLPPSVWGGASEMRAEYEASLL